MSRNHTLLRFMQNHLPFWEVLPRLSSSPFVLRASFRRSAFSPDAPQPALDPLTIEQAIRIKIHIATLQDFPDSIIFNMIQIYSTIPNSILSVAKSMTQRERMFVWGAFCRASLKLGRISSFSSRPHSTRLKRSNPCRTGLLSGKYGKPV